MPLQLENMHTTIPTDYNYTSGQTDDFIDNLQWDSFTSLYLNGPMWTQFGHWWSRTFQSASGNSHCYYNFLFLKLCLFYTVWMVSVRRKELNADTRFSEVSCSCDWTPLVWGKSRSYVTSTNRLNMLPMDKWFRQSVGLIGATLTKHNASV